MMDITREKVEDLRQETMRRLRLIRENYDKTRMVLDCDPDTMLQRLSDAQERLTVILNGCVEDDTEAILQLLAELDELRCYFGANTVMPLSEKGIENVNPYLRVLDMLMILSPDQLLYAELMRISYAVIDFRITNGVPVEQRLIHRLMKSAALYMELRRMRNVNEGNTAKLMLYFRRIHEQLTSLCEENEVPREYLYDFDLHLLVAANLFSGAQGVFDQELTGQMLDALSYFVRERALTRTTAQRICMAAGCLWHSAPLTKEQQELLAALNEIARQVIDNG